MDRLQEILNTMDVPEKRRTDLFWLKMNICIRNAEHPEIIEATRLIIENINKCEEFCLDYTGGL